MPTGHLAFHLHAKLSHNFQHGESRVHLKTRVSYRFQTDSVRESGFIISRGLWGSALPDGGKIGHVTPTLQSGTAL